MTLVTCSCKHGALRCLCLLLASPRHSFPDGSAPALPGSSCSERDSLPPGSCRPPSVRPRSFFDRGRRDEPSPGISFLSLTCHLEFLCPSVCLSSNICSAMPLSPLQMHLSLSRCTSPQALGALPRTW